MSYLRVPEWSPEEVAEWIKGLDDCFRPYVQSFLNNDVNGRHLMAISSDDLNHLNIWKIGHQELLMEAVEQLRQSFYDLDVENLQWLALKLSCKAKSLFKELSKSVLLPSLYPSSNNHHNYYHHHYHHHQSSLTEQQQTTLKKNHEQVATTTLSAVADLITSVKALVTWIDRPPFAGQQSFREKRAILLEKSVELAMNAQRDKFAEKPNEIIRDICYQIDTMCDELIKEKRDPFVLQPTSLEIATIKKKPNEELGMHISSIYCGVHVIGSIKYQSPTSACGRVETGDEIVQVNYQTVVGWQLKKLVLAMKENSSEVILTLKKRPKHSNMFGRILSNNFLFMSKRLSPKSAVPKSVAKLSVESPLKELRMASLKPPEVSILKQPSNVSLSVPPPQPPLPTAISIEVPPPAVCAPEMTTEDEDDDSAFLSEADSRSLVSDVHLSIPKMHVALQRRATVTGASPTALRPPVSIDQLWHNAKRDQIKRCYSHDVSRKDLVLEKLELKSEIKESFGGCEKQIKPPIKLQAHQKEREKTSTDVDNGSVELKKPAVLPNTSLLPSFSYQVVIVGGVPHRQPSNGRDFRDTSSTLPVLRKKRKSRIHSKRRVSCKDLGEGECQGWLYRWKEIKGMFLNSHKWVKEWCVLKNRNFYIYDDEEAVRARCFICLKGFNVSPALDYCKSKRFAFHIYRSGANFLFCSESQSDLSKWMNKLGLAAIDYDSTSNQKNDKISRSTLKPDEDYSETEDEDEDELAPSSSDDHSSLVSTNQVETASTSSLSSTSSHQSAADIFEMSNALNSSQPKKDQLATRIVKCKSLDWKHFPKGLDPFPAVTTPPVTEVAKMSLAFEMNLDSAPSSPLKKTSDQPPLSPKLVPKMFLSPKLVKKSYSRAVKVQERSENREWYTGEYAATLPAMVPSYKSSQRTPEVLERRTLGSLKLTRVFPLYKKADLSGHRLRELQSTNESWKPFRISSIPSHQDEDDTAAVAVGEDEHIDDDLSTPKPICKPAMGVSMIGKQRRTSENRSSSCSQTMTTISQATQTDIGDDNVDHLARMVMHLHAADLHIDGTQKFIRQKNSAFCPHPVRRKSALILHLRALHRTLTAKERDLEVIQKLLSSKEVTSRMLKKFTGDNQHIME